MTEEWRDIPDYPNYRVSNLGRVWSKPRNSTSGGLMKLSQDRNGYLKVGLTHDGVRATVMVHILVALAFLGPRPDGHEVRHRNGDPTDPRPENLAWGTRSENVKDQVEHGVHHLSRRTHCKYGHEFTPSNTVPRHDGGGRYCRKCKNNSGAKARAKRKEMK